MSGANEFLSLSPVIYVEAVEPCLAFWSDRLGFQSVAEVPGTNGLNFVILVRDSVTVMLQTFQSRAEDTPALAGAAADAFLFMKVKGLDSLISELDPVTVVVPRRTTFYGSDEIAVRPHEGCIVCLAEFADES